MLNKKFLKWFVFCEHFQYDLHTFALDIVPAEVEFFDGVKALRSSTQTFKAIMTQLAMAETQNLEFVQSFRDFWQMWTNVDVQNIFSKTQLLKMISFIKRFHNRIKRVYVKVCLIERELFDITTFFTEKIGEHACLLFSEF